MLLQLIPQIWTSWVLVSVRVVQICVRFSGVFLLVFGSSLVHGVHVCEVKAMGTATVFLRAGSCSHSLCTLCCGVVERGSQYCQWWKALIL